MHFINEEKFSEALEKINSLKTELKKDFLYKYCHILMRHQPSTFFTSIMKIN